MYSDIFKMKDTKYCKILFHTVQVYATKLIKKKYVKKHFWTLSAWILRKTDFLTHEGATCQWRRVKPVLQFSHRLFIAVFMDTCTAVTHLPHMCRLVLPVVEAPSEKAVLGLRPILMRKSLIRIPWPLHLPYFLLHGWVIPESAEGQQNQHVRKGKIIFRRYWFQERKC